jgi:hypothetical protein
VNCADPYQNKFEAMSQIQCRTSFSSERLRIVIPNPHEAQKRAMPRYSATEPIS